MQSIANSQVQQALNQQREEQTAKLMADFDSWQKQQQDPAQLMADFDAWKSSQNQQPTQTIPSIADTQPKRDLQAEAKEYFANVRKERREEKARNLAFKNNAEDYLRQQQEENELASMSTKRSKEEIAKKAVEDKEVKPFVPEANIKDQNSVNDYRKALLSGADTEKAKKTEAVLGDKREVETQKQLNAIPESAIEQYAQQKGISVDAARAEVEEAIRKANIGNTTIAPTNAAKIDQEATEEAQALIAEQKRLANQKQYTPYESFTGNMSKAVTDVVNGPVYLAGKLTGNDWDLYNDRQREEIANMREQHPTASNVGTMAGMALAAYGAGGGTGGRALAQEGLPTAAEAFNAAQGEALLNGATKGAANLTGLNVAGRQIASNAAKDLLKTDLATDIIPTLANDIAEGKSAKEVALNTALNTGLNFGFNSIGDVASLYKPLKNSLGNGNANFTPKPEYFGMKFTPGDYKDALKNAEITRDEVISQTTPEFQNVLKRLQNNEIVSHDELMKLPEVQYAESRVKPGDSWEEFLANPTKKRIDLQNKLADDYYARGSAKIDENGNVQYNGDVERGKKVFFVTGLPASGKSSTLVDRISQLYKARVLDSDDIKFVHPEFDNGFGGNYIHEECKQILRNVTKKSIDNGDNVVIPIIGGGNPKKLAERIKAFQDKGWEVALCQNDLPSNKAIGRAMSRYITDGRYIPPGVLMEYADTPHNNYLEMIERGKEYGLKDLSGFARVDNDVAPGTRAITKEYGGNLAALFGNPEDQLKNSNGKMVLGERSGEGVGLSGRSGRVSNIDDGGINYGTAVNGTGNQGSIRPQEPVSGGSEASRSLDTARVDTSQNGGASNLRNVVDESLSRKMDEAGINNFGLKDTSNNPQSFSNQLAEAKSQNPNGRMVSNQSAEDLAGAKIYTDDANTCGVAVKSDGDIVGVHKNPSNKTKGAVDDMLITARANGGTKLDCYGSGLVSKYEKDGFIPVAKVEWNEKFKPDDWGDNPPETVYVMMRDNRTNEQVLEDIKNGTFKTSTPEELEKLPTYSVAEYGDAAYDEAMKYRDSLLDMNLQYFAEKQPTKQGAFFDGVGKERGQSIHMRGEGKMQMEGVADEVAAEFKDQPDMYKVLKNADTKAKAEQIYNTAEDPLIEFRDMLRQKDPAALPLGHQLAKDYSAEGNYEAAAQIYREMGEELTKAGQFSQAAAINMMKNDPLTALEYAKREINNLNQAGAKRFGDKWKDFELTDDEVKAFNNIKPGDEEAIKSLFDQIGERIGKDYPTTFMDKLLEGRKVAMLFNVRTNVRNVLANVPTLGMRWTADRVEAVGQNIAHLINPEIEVTQAVRGSGKEGRRLAKQAFESKRVQSLLEDTPGKYEIPELRNALTKNKQMYKGTKVEKWLDEITGGGIQKVNEKLFGKKGVQSGLETIRNATYKMLDLGDKPFVKENFVERLGSYIRAKGIKNIDEIPDEAIQMAWDEAMKATYKDNSWAVQMLGGIKKGIEKVPGVGRPISQAAIPFLQAPGNIAARMVDYSPVKAAKGIGDIISGASKNDAKAVTKGIEEAAKGLTGSGLILLGIGLRNSGLITGTYSDDKDQKAFEKQNGFKEFALHIGDKYFTYDWAQPFSEELILGTLLADAINKSDQYDSDILRYFGYEGTKAGHVIGGLKEGTKGAVNSWFNSSPLQGLADLMKGSYNNQSDVAQNLWDTGVSDFASAFVPSAVNAVAKSIDPVRRNTYNPNNSFGSFVDSNVAKIPGLSKTLPAKYDTWGREMKYADNTKLFGMPVDEHVMSTASRFLVPGEYSYDRNDPVDKEINRLFESTNDNGVFPLVANNSVGDTKLNNRQVSEYQKDMGERSRAFTEALVNSEAYKSMEDDSKVDTLKKLYGVSKAITERDLFGKDVSESSTYKKAIQIYDDAGKGEKGVEALMNYYTAKSISDQAGISANSNAAKAIQEKIESGDTEEAHSMAEQVEKLPTLGLDSPAAKGAYTKAYGVYGKGYSAEEFSKTFKAIDKDGNQALKKDDEVIPYMNSQHMNYSDGMKFWKAFAKTEGSNPWKIPSLKDGTWK